MAHIHEQLLNGDGIFYRFERLTVDCNNLPPASWCAKRHFAVRGSEYMRKLFIVALLFVAACGQKSEEASRTSAEEAVSGPNVGVSSAPGLSLTYRYGFLLPPERVATAQEDHAARCEALGSNLCRISAMSYEVGRDRTISASLQLKLAPQAARQFGREAINLTTKHGGMLTSSRIESEETGQAVASSQAEQKSLAADRARIENQLKRTDLGSAERQELQAQMSTLGSDIRDAQTVQRDASLKLTTTPMTLDYASGNVDQSLSDGPIIGAIKDGWTNIVSGISVIIMIAITLLPWLLTGALVIVLWRKYFRRWLFSESHPGRE
ncbi:DUF4349 domain-containing protein [Sphingobium sp. DEHP117]|uniref:DUF4349 domain-containing protein n=1 Tax=Sphingobium sp. DEHP117 TaxID=2993436 RepID=UPI0027D5EB62|nr:DUF4349 domain-containing protein [Sphingobium sp. DEHP117]MDQ4419524.1 DUF4349 domain-containing protein [Sphingobium sp. DEHP117]